MPTCVPNALLCILGARKPAMGTNRDTRNRGPDTPAQSCRLGSMWRRAARARRDRCFPGGGGGRRGWEQVPCHKEQHEQRPGWPRWGHKRELGAPKPRHTEKPPLRKAFLQTRVPRRENQASAVRNIREPSPHPRGVHKEGGTAADRPSAGQV